jgi:RNA polymerase-binding transcription factor DksA
MPEVSEYGDCAKCGKPIEVPWLMVKLCEGCLDAALAEADRVKGERGVRDNAARVARLANR